MPKFNTQKVEFEYIAELCKFTRCSFLMYLDWENDNVMKYQITRPDEYQTEVTSVNEAVEILEILEGNQKRLNMWSWI